MSNPHSPLDAISANLAPAIRKQKYKYATAQEKQSMINAYIGGKTAKEAARLFGFDKNTCLRYLRKFNIARREPNFRIRRIRQYDETFFDNIDTEEKAYWLGFITADGCVSDGNRLSIGLAIKDFEHLEKFKKSIKSDHNITIREGKGKLDLGKQRCEITIISKQIVQSLKDLGVNPRKTNRYLITRFTSINLRRHYWRGLIDGDGSIYIGKNNTKVRKPYIYLCGTFELVDGFRHYCDAFLDKKTKTHISKKKYESGFELFLVHYNGIKSSKLISEHLYQNSTVYLTRKKQKAEFLSSLSIPIGNYIHITIDQILTNYKKVGSWAKTAKELKISQSGLRCKLRKLGIVA